MNNNWEKIQLRKLGYSYGGLTNKTKDDFGEGKPYIPYLNIFENSKIDPDNLDHVQINKNEHQNTVEFGDLFFTTSSETPDEVGMTSVLLDELKETYLNSFCFGFRLHNFNDLLPKYAAYLFRGYPVRKEISLLAQGSTRYNLSKNILFDKLYLDLPPLPQQRKIANILSTCDQVIEQTEKAIEKYQVIKKGMMQDLFTRGIDLQTGKLRPKYKDAPHLYKETELGWIPKEWEVKKFGDLTSETILGLSMRGSSNSKDNIPLLKMGNLKWGELKLDQIEKIDPILVDRRYLLSFGDFLFNTRNTPELVGKTTVWKKEYPIATFDNNLLRIRFKTGYSSFFINHYMSFGAGKNRLKSIVKGTTSVAAIYWKNLTEYKLPIANNLEQNEIKAKIEAIEKKIQLEESILFKYKKLKEGLMQDLLTGKVEVEEKAEMGKS